MRSTAGTKTLWGAVLLVALTTAGSRGTEARQEASPAATAAATAEATPDQAKEFLGTWVATVEAPSGPTAFTIDIKVDAGRLVAVVGHDAMGENRVQRVTRTATALVMTYAVDLMGNPADITLSLMPREQAMWAQFTINQGQLELSGPAVRKNP